MLQGTNGLFGRAALYATVNLYSNVAPLQRQMIDGSLRPMFRQMPYPARFPARDARVPLVRWRTSFRSVRRRQRTRWSALPRQRLSRPLNTILLQADSSTTGEWSERTHLFWTRLRSPLPSLRYRRLTWMRVDDSGCSCSVIAEQHSTCSTPPANGLRAFGLLCSLSEPTALQLCPFDFRRWSDLPPAQHSSPAPTHRTHASHARTQLRAVTRTFHWYRSEKWNRCPTQRFVR